MHPLSIWLCPRSKRHLIMLRTKGFSRQFDTHQHCFVRAKGNQFLNTKVTKAFLYVKTVSTGTSQEDSSRVCSAMSVALTHPFSRVARAIEADTERLAEECLGYRQAVITEQERLENLEKALRATHWSPGTSQNDDLIERYDRSNFSRGGNATPIIRTHINPIFRTEESFRDEIAVLTAACQQHEEELKQMQALEAEQVHISQELDGVDDYLDEERNRLQIDARAFGHIRQQLSKSLRDTQREIESLSTVRLHAALFHLVVDKRGLRYPLINELRLAYRPKGDVHWKEINAAWAQATQLLLLVAASVKFQSKDWRIVPLTSCAKLIYLDGKHRAVYTLGGTEDPASQHVIKMSMSLRAMNALLDQMCRHVSALKLGQEAPPLPYETTRNRIGSWELSQLDDLNDSGWSSVIHCIASNLQWISDRASDYEIQHVTITV